MENTKYDDHFYLETQYNDIEINNCEQGRTLYDEIMEIESYFFTVEYNFVNTKNFNNNPNDQEFVYLSEHIQNYQYQKHLYIVSIRYHLKEDVNNNPDNFILGTFCYIYYYKLYPKICKLWKHKRKMMMEEI